MEGQVTAASTVPTHDVPGDALGAFRSVFETELGYVWRSLARLGVREPSGPVPDARPLTDSAAPGLPRMSLLPLPGPGGPWTLGSELVFLGRSAACGVRVRGASAARVHAVLVRDPRASYVVNLVGAGLWLDGRPVRDAAPLGPGMVLNLYPSKAGAR